jgi:hypothetical protein
MRGKPNSREHKPGICGLVAGEDMLSDELQLNAEVNKNLKSRVSINTEQWLDLYNHNNRQLTPKSMKASN